MEATQEAQTEKIALALARSRATNKRPRERLYDTASRTPEEYDQVTQKILKGLTTREAE